MGSEIFHWRHSEAGRRPVDSKRSNLEENEVEMRECPMRSIDFSEDLKSGACCRQECVLYFQSNICARGVAVCTQSCHCRTNPVEYATPAKSV